MAASYFAVGRVALGLEACGSGLVGFNQLNVSYGKRCNEFRKISHYRQHDELIFRLCMFSLTFELYASSEFIVSLVIGLLLADIIINVTKLLSL